MKSITIHQLDDKLAEELQKRAKDENTSMNKTIKQILRLALGLDAPNMNRTDFTDLAGVWSQEDLVEFESRTGDLSRVREEDWL